MLTIDAERIKQQARQIGFHAVGIAAIHHWRDGQKGDGAATRLQAWLQQGYQADMGWMADPRRQDVLRVMPEARSLIVVALNYYTPHVRSTQPTHGKIARYAWGRDYHRVMQTRLKALALWLQQQGDGILTRYYVDTGPIQDKLWAERAGLGWIAKNSNLITRQFGSWVFLGEVLTNLDLTPDRPHTAHCGTCTRCITACPTNAIRPVATAETGQPAFAVDANRCIAYHTIENRAEQLPAEITPHLQGWVAGCDICQDVCPWNQRFAQATDVAEFQPYPTNLAPDLQLLATLSDTDWDYRFRASALRRIKPAMFRRNARAVMEG